MTKDARPDRDRTYPHADLVGGYITRREVKTFHVAGAERSGKTACGLTLADLIEAGWARQLRRRGLNLCSKCAGLVDLNAPLETEDEDE